MFALNPGMIYWAQGVLFLDVVLVPLVVFLSIGHEEYLLTAVFGSLFAGLADPGGRFGYRASHLGLFSLIGAGVTALAFGVSGSGWGLLTVVAFAVTLLAGLAVVFGVHRYVAGTLLNVWFIIGLGLGFSLDQQPNVTSHIWAQVVSWLGGSALWIAVTFAGWLMLGREKRPQPFPAMPGDTTGRKLTRPVVLFATVRAVVIGGAVAIAFGFDLSHGYWLPIAALAAMQTSLAQTTLVAVQRLSGALIGAGAAALLLLIPSSEQGLHRVAVQHALEIVALVLLMHGIAVRFWNYAFYSAAVAAGVLILLDLPRSSNNSAVGYRVLWTVCGAGLSVLVMAFAALLGRRRPGSAGPRTGGGSRG
ncbi:FUSC family protein [Asanoa iriomotensis]|uniref:Integral membrane bound transporter domain-containing protein n=1 Tax=Asanoa iriomotensis TaxID=234613 RepID=A0ABQ4C3N1_9ACTN|nr:FUSC family protein [Asanoa iriomotensis]GIF57377.1 hypothetical protein Air01nite_34720 [Asanoa iriomotensis]